MSETSQVLNSLGLICNIIGVGLVWYYGWPQPSHQDGIGRALQKNTLQVAKKNADVKNRRAHYTFQSSAGLVFLGLGFAFQLIAVWK